ncbi:DUF397 domain-containing protein [Streptomyces sp. NPDC059104]|uniref:DUF397 domain-containing protein n=1 Tax=Streptomyces sp. NPDC059104 TaxID=3346729 RepID=UPI00367C3707
MASTENDLASVSWRKSSYSNGTGGECVEVADGLAGLVPVRDSKVPGGPVIAVSAAAWGPFVEALKGGTAPDGPRPR